MDSESLIDEFLELRSHLSLVHQVPGRMRLRLGAGLWSRAGELSDTGLRKGLASVQGIKDVRLNLAAASLVIEYDPKVMSPDDWQSLFEADEEIAREVLTGWFG